MSEEEKIERLLNSIAKGCDGNIADEVKAIIIKQQKLIDIFIHNEAVKEGKDFNEIKEKYYECL